MIRLMSIQFQIRIQLTMKFVNIKCKKNNNFVQSLPKIVVLLVYQILSLLVDLKLKIKANSKKMYINETFIKFKTKHTNKPL